MPAVAASKRHRLPLATLAGRHACGTALWLGHELAAPARPACPSGFAELDAQLPGGGWPAGGLTELMHETGSGEIRLLAPALRRLGTGPRELVWIAPPHPPYAPAVQALSLSLARLLWLRADHPADAAWAAEQVLRSGSAGAVLWWSRQVLPATLRRLHLVAQEGGTPLFALRPPAARAHASPAPLRLALQALAGSRLEIDLFKRNGPALARPLQLVLPPAANGALSYTAPARDRRLAAHAGEAAGTHPGPPEHTGAPCVALQ